MSENKNIEKIPFKKLSISSLRQRNDVVSFQNMFSSEVEDKTPPTHSSKQEHNDTPPSPAISQDDLTSAKQQSFEEGYAKGFDSAKAADAEIQLKIQTSLKDITNQLSIITEKLQQSQIATSKELVDLSLCIAKKIIGDNVHTESVVEVEAIILQNLKLLMTAPIVNIYVSPDIENHISEFVATVLQDNNYDINITVHGKQEFSEGGCEIDFQDSKIKKDNKNQIQQKIEELCQEFSFC